MTEPGAELLRTIRSRRVARALTAQPVTRDQLDTVLEAASFAPSAGNRRLHPLVVVTDPGRLSVLRLVSPGMLQRPAAAIVICIDQANARRFGFRPGTQACTWTWAPSRRQSCWRRTLSDLAPDRLLRSVARPQRTCWTCPTGGSPGSSCAWAILPSISPQECAPVGAATRWTAPCGGSGRGGHDTQDRLGAAAVAAPSCYGMPTPLITTGW